MKSNTAICAVALSVEFGPGKEVQLLPAGEFRATDGRPANLPAWKINAAIAARIIGIASRAANDIVIDYEHQTILATKNGQPAPAAGWFKQMEWREGVGLFATDVRWTPRAAAMIRAREYRYFSPTFSFDPATGEVTKILHAGLTNSPALDGMASVALRAGASSADAATSLSEQEIETCRLMGISPDDYLKTKSAEGAAAAHFTGELSDGQLQICRQMGIEPSAFLRTLQENIP